MSEDIKITGKILEKFPDVVKALSAVKKAYALTNARFGLLFATRLSPIPQKNFLLKFGKAI